MYNHQRPSPKARGCQVYKILKFTEVYRALIIQGYFQRQTWFRNAGPPTGKKRRGFMDRPLFLYLLELKLKVSHLSELMRCIWRTYTCIHSHNNLVGILAHTVPLLHRQQQCCTNSSSSAGLVVVVVAAVPLDIVRVLVVATV